jgi:hypothetical protein
VRPSTREFGAFGKNTDPFSEATYLRLNWPAALTSFADGAKYIFQQLGIATDASGNIRRPLSLCSSGHPRLTKRGG